MKQKCNEMADDIKIQISKVVKNGERTDLRFSFGYGSNDQCALYKMEN